MIYTDIEQRTPEWIQLRIGKVTGSRISDVLAEIKKGEAAGRRNYRAEIVCETLTHLSCEDRYVTREMQWGIDQEPFARAAYEFQREVMVQSVGFAVHPEIPRFGVSPDGLIGDDGMLQIKCPMTSTHIGYILAGEVPADYGDQMQAEMACAGRQWTDFVSFDPRLPEHLQLFVRRLNRDNAKIAEIELKVLKFLGEVDAVLVKLGMPPQPEPVYVPAVAEALVASVPVTISRAALLATEVRHCLQFYFAGFGTLESQLRLGACDLIFDVKSEDALQFLPVPTLERGWRILHAYEKFSKHNLGSRAEVLLQLHDAIVEYENGESAEWELPF